MAEDDPTVPNPLTERQVQQIKQLKKDLKEAATEQRRLAEVTAQFNAEVRNQELALKQLDAALASEAITQAEYVQLQKESYDAIQLANDGLKQNQAELAQSREAAARYNEELEETNKLLAVKKGLIADVSEVMGSIFGPELSKITGSTKDLSKEFISL